MKRVALFLFLAVGVLGAQINPPKYSAYVNSGSGWVPWAAAAGGAGISQPPSIALYCKASASAPWTPCTGSGGGGGGGTVTAFTAGTLAPLFTTSVDTGTTTPHLNFILTNAPANSVLCNATAGAAAPAYSAACATSGANITALNAGNVSTGVLALARGGTAAAPSAADQVVTTTTSSTAAAWSSIANCATAVTYSTTTHSFACNSAGAFTTLTASSGVSTFRDIRIGQTVPQGIDTVSGNPMQIGPSLIPLADIVYSFGQVSRRWSTIFAQIYTTATAGNTDSAMQLSIPATTGGATYTTTATYLNHPVCSGAAVLDTAANAAALGGLGFNWVGANGGTNTTPNSPTGTWTLTITPGTNPGTPVVINVTCFPRV